MFVPEHVSPTPTATDLDAIAGALVRDPFRIAGTVPSGDSGGHAWREIRRISQNVRYTANPLARRWGPTYLLGLESSFLRRDRRFRRLTGAHAKE